MSNEGFSSEQDAIADAMEEAENMKLRSFLMQALKNHLLRNNISQAEAARMIGVSQPRISDLMRGKIHLFSVDSLVNMAAAAGLRLDIRVQETL